MKNQLRFAPAEHQWSQGDPAERLGAVLQPVNAIETGKCDPALLLALKIAKVLGKPIEQLFFPKDTELRD